MPRLDLDQADRDAATEQRIERDAHREPGRQHRHPRCATSPLAGRRAFQVGVQDSVNAAKAAAESEVTMRLECPTCRGPVYAPRDSHLDALTCAGCDAPLLTRRTIDGVALDVRS